MPNREQKPKHRTAENGPPPALKKPERKPEALKHLNRIWERANAEPHCPVVALRSIQYPKKKRFSKIACEANSLSSKKA